MISHLPPVIMRFGRMMVVAWNDGGGLMRIQRSSHQECVVLTLAGRLDLAAAPQVQRAILKQLAESPPAIICDLGQVEAIDPVCAGLFTSIRHPALGWPGAALLLCGARPAVADALMRHGVARYLAMYPSLEQALQHAGAQPPRLRERRALRPVPGAAGAGRGPSGVTSAPGPDLLRTKLVPPAPRAGLIPRASLHSLLQAGLRGKLCLLAAPAGFGKTALLAQWCAVAGAGRVAWVSLDDGDNDPTRFWLSVVEALRTVQPTMGAAALAALRRGSADLDSVVLRLLLNDLHAVGLQLVLVLDDYHLVTNPTCHRALGFFLDHLPVGVHVALSTRLDPPLPLVRMRARGELTELRVAELRFTTEEASALLNGAMGLQLATEDVERLAARTEGWAAGLVLAGLSLRGRQDPNGFTASFHGDDRHVAGFLGSEVLARQPEAVRTFLLRTSVLERLSGPLCDAVLETEGSAGLLRELERSNLFLVPLDDHREWYRYHQLFAKLLRLELDRREAALVPVLHRRAATWHRQAGDAVLLFDDVGRSVQAALRALELAGPQPSPYRWMAQAALGHNLYLSGQSAAARSQLEELVRNVSAAAQPYAVVGALAVLSLIASDEDDDGTAVALASRAVAIAETHGLRAEPVHGIVHLATGRTLTHQGRLTEAEERLGRALQLFGVDSMAVQRAHVLLALATVRHGRGDLPGARTVLEQVRELIEPWADPGVLPTLLQRTERALGSGPHRQIKVVAPLTERELTVLRPLPTRLSTREIARELYVSINTVRTHVRAIYRKLEVATRAEAVAHVRQRRPPPRA